MVEEKLSLQELEVRLKEEELRLKKAEVRSKEREIAASKWLNPVFLGLLAAALALLGNIYVSRENNKNTQAVERLHAQSTLILEAIKTNGDADAACKNLLFFAGIGLIQDENQTIMESCPDNMKGAPSVSLGPLQGPPDWFSGYRWYPLTVRTVEERGTPISDVIVEARLVPPVKIELFGDFLDSVSRDPIPFLGTLGRNSTRCKSKEDGNCFAAMAPSGKFMEIVAKKVGYREIRKTLQFAGNSIVLTLPKDAPSH